MKRSKFTDSQIMDALKRVEAGLSVKEICREMACVFHADSAIDSMSIRPLIPR